MLSSPSSPSVAVVGTDADDAAAARPADATSMVRNDDASTAIAAAREGVHASGRDIVPLCRALGGAAPRGAGQGRGVRAGGRSPTTANQSVLWKVLSRR